mmetsp:Transcript_5252/g.14671  ORF Transcript_5252/g.14671 Transcript_5252/m.14671 type:complete len:214 (-) Transcript_5252:65-706(-)
MCSIDSEPALEPWKKPAALGLASSSSTFVSRDGALISTSKTSCKYSISAPKSNCASDRSMLSVVRRASGCAPKTAASTRGLMEAPGPECVFLQDGLSAPHRLPPSAGLHGGQRAAGQLRGNKKGALEGKSAAACSREPNAPAGRMPGVDMGAIASGLNGRADASPVGEGRVAALLVWPTSSGRRTPLPSFLTPRFPAMQPGVTALHATSARGV